MTSTTAAATGSKALSRGRLFALVSGVVYVSAGILGFIATGFDAPFTGLADTRVVILAINPLHNIIHLALGAGYAIGGLNDRAARYANVAIGVGLLAAFLLGVFGGAAFINIDGVAEPDNWLHLVWGAASTWVGVKTASR